MPQVVQIGQFHTRLPPKLSPPRLVRAKHLRMARVQRFGQTLSAQGNRIPTVVACGDGYGQQCGFAVAPGRGNHRVAESGDRLLQEPFRVPIRPGFGWRIPQGLHGSQRLIGQTPRALPDARSNQFPLLRRRARYPHQRYRRGCAKERLQPRPIAHFRSPHGVGQIERKLADALRRIELQFQSTAGQFRRPCRVVRRVEAFYQFGLVFLGDQARDGLPGAILFLELVLQALVPQVSAIERQADRVVVSPQQSAQQAVAQRDRLIPGRDGGGQLEVERRGWQEGVGFVAGPCRGGRDGQSRETHGGTEIFGDHGWFLRIEVFRTSLLPTTLVCHHAELRSVVGGVGCPGSLLFPPLSP